ncbi:MAG: hypothetical protein IPL78_29820 [Chloroflexi bacterium]|nr:hypothetical protein [Chloroflexota bacterium]
MRIPLRTTPRHRLNRRLDAMIAIIEASKNEDMLTQLEARAGITERVDLSVLLVLLYWHLVEHPL